MSDKVAIVAALPSEVRPLIRGWAVTRQSYDHRDYTFYESENAVLVCGGIGSEPARRATEAIIALFRPELVISAGFAGALDKNLGVGHVIRPSRIIDARDGSVTEIRGDGALVSFSTVADPDQKAKLAQAYRAQAVDMEAAAVARGAEARGLRFAAIKAISDTSEFAMPPMDRFVSHDGQFRSARFLVFVAVRPWLWGNVIRLARNSLQAAKALASAVNCELHAGLMESSAPEWHPIKHA